MPACYRSCVKGEEAAGWPPDKVIRIISAEWPDLEVI